MVRYDVVIVGGGLVGAGLAAALRGADLKIALMDDRLPSQHDPRLFALNASSCQFLENIGVWSALEKHASPIHQIHVSRRGHFGAVRLQREEMNVDALGHVIPAHFIEKALNESLETQKNLTLYRPARLIGLETPSSSVLPSFRGLTAESSAVAFSWQPLTTLDSADKPRNDEATLLIGADGTESSVRKFANINTEIADYGQSALVTRTTLQRSHHHIAYERFTKGGAIAMLPLAENECATIWTTEHALIDELMTLSDEAFIQRLQHEFGYRLGRLQTIAQRHRFPLRMVRAEKAFDKQVLLIGNAAHTLHPIAAQGFNLAVYEVAAISESILQQTSLSDAVAHIQQQQKASIGVSHYLPQLFAHDATWMSVLSQLGMVGLDNAPPLKRKFMTSMMGRTGHVPSLLLGVNE